MNQGGGGLETNYVWQFLSSPPGIPAFAADYWLPLTSLILAIPMKLFGAGLSQALLAPFFLGIAYLVLSYLVLRKSGRIASLLGVALLFLTPKLVQYSAQTNTGMAFGVFGLGALVLVSGKRSAGRAFAAGLLAGLAHLTRQDGIFLIVAGVTGLLLSRTRRFVPALVAGYAIVLASYLTWTFTTYGKLMPSSVTLTALFTNHEDLYALPGTMTLNRYLAQGLREILVQKAACLLVCMHRVVELTGGIAILLPAAFIRARSKLPLRLPVWFTYLLLSLSFFTIVATFPGRGGSFEKSFLPVIPFVVRAVFDALKLSDRRWLVILLSLLVVWNGREAFVTTRKVIRQNRAMGLEMQRLVQATNTHSIGPDAVLMTRNPWEISLSTGMRAVQIPSEPFSTIVRTAGKFHVTHLILPAPRPSIDTSSVEFEENFALVTEVDGTDLRIYRMRDR